MIYNQQNLTLFLAKRVVLTRNTFHVPIEIAKEKKNVLLSRKLWQSPILAEFFFKIILMVSFLK